MENTIQKHEAFRAREFNSNYKAHTPEMLIMESLSELVTNIYQCSVTAYLSVPQCEHGQAVRVVGWHMEGKI